MGQSFFLENRAPHFVQVLLLTFGILLCLKCGVDAVRCYNCHSDTPYAPCISENMECDGEFCTSTTVFDTKTRELIKYHKACGSPNMENACGTKWKNKGKTYKLYCCDTDLCNL